MIMNMRKFFTAVAVVFAAALSTSAQEFQPRLNLTFGGKRKADKADKMAEAAENYSFRIVNYDQAVWQKTFSTGDGTKEDIMTRIFESGKFRDIEDVGSAVTCTFLLTSRVPYLQFGFGDGDLPIFLLNAHGLEARFVFQFKPGLCRVTADRIYLFPGDSSGLSGGYLDSMIDSGQWFARKPIANSLQFLDMLFQDAVDFRKPGYLAPDF